MAKTIPKEITIALEKAFQQKSEGDDLSRVLYFLASEVANGTGAPYIQALGAVVQRPEVFKDVARRLADDTKTASEDPKFKQFMYDIWNMYLREDVFEQHIEKPRSFKSAFDTFLDAISEMSAIAFDTIRDIAKKVSTAAISSPSGALETLSTVVATLGTAVVKIGLVFAYLASEIVEYIKCWWNGQISGIACLGSIMLLSLPMVIGLTGVVVGVTLGAMAGAVLGAVAGPVGVLVGGAVGGYVGGLMAAPFVKLILGESFFDRQKHDALDNAYAILGVNKSATNSEVNSAYRRKALTCHPDKHPDKNKEWMLLQYSMTLVRVARGEA